MDDDNIFASGAEHDDRRAADAPATTTPLEHGALFSRAGELVLKNLDTLLPVIGAILVIGFLSVGIGLVAGVGQAMMPDLGLVFTIGQYTVSLLLSVAQLYITMAFIQMLLAIDRGEETSVDVLFDQGRNTLYTFAGYLLTALVAIPVVLLWIALFSIPAFGVAYAGVLSESVPVWVGGGLGLVVWFLVLLNPLFYFTATFGYVPAFVVDRGANPIDALVGSYELTAGNRWFLVGQQWLLFLLAIGTYCFTCGLALPLLPLIQVPLIVATYNALRADSAA
jgi:hypothetical protein